MRPPDTAERRPGGGGAQDGHGGGNVNAILRDATLIAAGIRRRRDAAGRLPPLAGGYRDPLDALAGKPIPRRAIECPGMFGDGGKWQPCCGRGAA
jgi:hypothetical protein